MLAPKVFRRYTMAAQRSRNMSRRKVLSLTASFCLAGSMTGLHAQPPAAETVLIGNDDIGGVVAGAKGGEAGVWVIAETAGLPTRFVRIVVTDDPARYLVPALPKA